MAAPLNSGATITGETSQEGSPHSNGESLAQAHTCFPPGLLGQTASLYYQFAHRPSEQISLSSAIGFMGGVIGNAYNIGTSGLNQYILQLAVTGAGKDIASEGSSRLISYIHDYETGKPFPFSAPGELVSAAGTIKWLEDNPCFNAIIGEFPKQLREMTNPKNVVQYGVGRQLLKLYTKSGRFGTYEPLAYSDRKNRTGVIRSPSLTIYAEGTPEEFYGFLTPALITDGLLPRFMVFEHRGKRPLHNKQSQHVKPDASVIQKWRDLVAHCLALRERGEAQQVSLETDAEELFDNYDSETTGFINNAHNEITRHLLNRAHLKALRLAALRSVGEDYLNPIISLDAAMWAIDLITEQTNNLISKFDNNEVGEEAGDEDKQRAHILRTMANYYAFPIDRWDNPDSMWRRHGIIRQSYIQAKVSSLPAFKNDRRGATKALKDMLMSMYECGELQMADAKGMSHIADKECKARSYYFPEPMLLEKYWPKSSPFETVLDFYCTLST
jgi:hypothetical protein